MGRERLLRRSGRRSTSRMISPRARRNNLQENENQNNQTQPVGNILNPSLTLSFSSCSTAEGTNIIYSLLPLFCYIEALHKETLMAQTFLMLWKNIAFVLFKKNLL